MTDNQARFAKIALVYLVLEVIHIALSVYIADHWKTISDDL